MPFHTLLGLAKIPKGLYVYRRMSGSPNHEGVKCKQGFILRRDNFINPFRVDEKIRHVVL
jgi:hypothetical protein